MKNVVKFLILICCICLLDACKETKQEGKKPDPIVEYSITQIHGGATITYSIPEDPDILYVMAEYERNGKPFTERSSTYKNWITIEGFNTTDQVSVSLYTVSRHSETKSDPLMVEFVPLESVISLIRESTNVSTCFGGIQITWENITQTELGMFLMVDSLGTLIEKDVYFSSMASELHYVRGLEPVETLFALTYEDKWGNVSEPIYFTETPLFETEVPKPWIDLRHMIPHDNTTHLSPYYYFSNLWDGLLGNDNRYLSDLGGAGSSMTFDFGQEVHLSRFAMWNFMSPNFDATTNVYGQVNILEFEMWGTKEIDQSKLDDPSYWLHPISAAQTGQTLPAHTFMDDWVFLGRFSVERLDLMGASQADIRALGERGHHFDIPYECGPVRIIRFYPIATLGGSPPPSNYWQMGEFSFFGDITIPQ